jgi:hypothetical protein
MGSNPSAAMATSADSSRQGYGARRDKDMLSLCSLRATCRANRPAGGHPLRWATVAGRWMVRALVHARAANDKSIESPRAVESFHRPALRRLNNVVARKHRRMRRCSRNETCQPRPTGETACIGRCKVVAPAWLAAGRGDLSLDRRWPWYAVCVSVHGRLGFSAALTLCTQVCLWLG